jgi:hypothetical protein
LFKEDDGRQGKGNVTIAIFLNTLKHNMTAGRESKE